MVRRADESPSSLPSDPNTVTLLELAEAGDVQGLQRWVEKKGLNANCFSKDGRWSPLVKAVWAGQLAAVQWLVEHGKAQVNLATPEYGFTALHQAAMNGHTDITKWLLDFGEATPDVATKNGSTTLVLAAGRGNLEVFQLLLEHSSTNPRYMIHRANNLQFTAAHVAAREGHVECLRLLIKKRYISGDDAWLAGNDTTPLISAIRNRYNNEVILCLIRDGQADVTKTATNDKTRDTALHAACAMGMLEIVQELVQRGAQVEATNTFGETPLFAACRANRTPVVKYLIHEAGANVNARRPGGNTPLLFAIQSKLWSVVECLIQCSNIDLEIPDFRGMTALMCACVKEREDAVEWLIDADASIDAVHHENVGSALHVACSQSSLSVVRLLVERGKASANLIRPNDGMTPLMIACQRVQIETARYLIQEVRVDLRTYNNEGLSARDICKCKKNLDLALQQTYNQILEIFAEQEQYHQKHWNLVQSVVENGWLRPSRTLPH